MSSEAEALDIHVLVEIFEGWLDRYEKQPFYSLQGAYEHWLKDDGFDHFADDYSVAVAVILVYLSRAVVNPNYRRYCCDPTDQNDQFAILQVLAPSMDDSHITYWEFFTEENFRMLYADWKAGQDDPGGARE